MVTQTERVLWQHWRAGRDERAFEQLVAGHIPFALDFARRRGCSPADADDIVQQALTRLVQERSDRPVEVGLRAWLGRTVSLQATMLRRDEARRARREHAVAIEAPASAADRLEQREEVESALAALPANLREAVVLRYLHDLEYREMAHVLDTTENACRIRVHRGIDMLREKLRRGPETSLALLPLLAGRPGTDLLRVSLATKAPIGLAATVAGVLIMKKVLVVISLLAAATVGVLFIQSGDSADDKEARTRHIATAPETRPPPEPAPPEPEPAAAPPPAPSADAAAAEPTLIEAILTAGGKVAFSPREVYLKNGSADRWYESAPDVPGPITGVSFINGEIGALLPRLAELGSLHWAMLYGTDIDDAGVELLAGVPALDGLHLGRTKVTDEGLRHVGLMASLTMLSLHDTKVTDEGLGHLTGLSRLTNLDIHDLKVTDDGLVHVGKLTQLEHVRLGGTYVTDEGLRHLSMLDRLTHLDVEEARLTGSGLKHMNQSHLVDITCEAAKRIDDSFLEAIRAAPSLRRLNLEETAVTNEGLKHLAQVGALEWLHLGGTRVTDAGLAHLAALDRLKLLNLEDTSVSDAGIEHLARLRALRKLYLKETRVTPDGIARLRAALPECEIKVD